MNIEKIAISECKAGNILASDVYNSNGVTLVAKDTVINDYLKERLISLGIPNIHIYVSTDSNKNSSISYVEFKRNYNEIVLQTQNMLHDLAAGKPIVYENICSISDRIGKNLKDNIRIISYLTEVRGVDEYTYTHCINAAFYSMLIAKWLKLPDHEIEKSIKAGLLHDIGKSKIPTEILNKKGTLTKDEYEIIKKHPTLGFEILEGQDGIDSDIKRSVLLHHERTDGSGYPFNATSGHINIISKIVAIADVFDAMTSDRVYKKRVTPFKAFEMFQAGGVAKYDIEALRVFLDNMSAYLVGSKVLLSNGETGEIVYIPAQNLTRPIVKVSSGYLDLSQENTVNITSMI
jgi:putative nucleotidyltransferase with HDIG domain